MAPFQVRPTLGPAPDKEPPMLSTYIMDLYLQIHLAWGLYWAQFGSSAVHLGATRGFMWGSFALMHCMGVMIVEEGFKGRISWIHLGFGALNAARTMVPELSKVRGHGT